MYVCMYVCMYDGEYYCFSYAVAQSWSSALYGTIPLLVSVATFTAFIGTGYVCMYVCMYVFVCVYVCVIVCVCVSVYMYVCMYVRSFYLFCTSHFRIK